MNDIDISRLDLNLLSALDALLAEASVTRAAHRLGVGQPAASHALGRLRALLGDPLLVRSGRRMILTPRAEALRAPLAEILSAVARLVRHEASFDPASSARSFRLVAPDLLAGLLPPVIARLAGEAPRARLEVASRAPDELTALEEGRADLALVPAPETGPGLRMRRLGTVRFAVVARRGHPAVTGRKLGKRAWTAYPHVMVRSGSSSRSVVADALARSGLSRHVGLVVPGFLAALVAVAHSDLLFAAPRQLVAPLADRLRLSLIAPPVAVPAVPVAAVWHERFDAEPGHQFFRTLVCEELGAALR